MEANSNSNSTNNPAATISAAFPAPPPFYKAFTPGNLAALAAHRQEESNSQSALSCPPQEGIRYLIPPRPPGDGRYRSFGVVHDISLPTAPAAAAASFSISSLQQQQQHPAESQAAEQSSRRPPTPKRLLDITHNILLTFLALTHALAGAPATYAPIWDRLHALFQDAHAVVNDYRPHQARETLIAMMEAQVARAREEGRRAREMGAKVKAVLEGLGGGGGGGELAVDDSRGGVGVVNGRREDGMRGEDGEGDEEMKRIWETVGREVGFV